MKSARIVNPEILGDVLRAARMGKGISQRKLAEELGVSQRYVVEIEHGKPTKAVERLFEFMMALDVVLTAEVADDAAPR